MHTDLSHDGAETLADLRTLFKGHGHSFVCLTDHSQDVSPEQFEELVACCQRLSDESFVFIPGLEYSCDGEIHIMGIGIREKTSETEPGRVVDRIHEHGGVAVLSHPTKSSKYTFEEAWVKKLDGAEIWNRGVDSRIAPESKSIRQFLRFREINPSILAFYGQDLHRRKTYIDLAVQVEATGCRPDLIVEAMRRGEFRCWSPLFRISAKADLSPFKRWFMQIAKALFNTARRLKEIL